MDPPPPWVFEILQYFETILPSVESFWSSLQDEVYVIGGVAVGACDVTKKVGRHLGFFHELEIG